MRGTSIALYIGVGSKQNAVNRKETEKKMINLTKAMISGLFIGCFLNALIGMLIILL